MKNELFKTIDELKDSLINDVCDLVKIESIQGESTVDFPYGKNVSDALSHALKICEREGLLTKNIDNQMGYGQYGESKEYIGIFGHLDVVEVGDGWKYPPFSATISENKIWGRGALDNKGPIIAALYGLLALKKLNICPKRAIRIVFGTNEETGMNDIKHYLEKENPPIMGFTPDNKFPAIYGERGRAVIEVENEISLMVDFINEYFMNAKPNGDRLGINVFDNDFKEMIIRNKKIDYKNNKMSIKFSLSTPVCDINEIIEKISLKSNGGSVKLISWAPWVLHNKDATLIKTLNDAYNEIFDTNLEPTTTTGGTYAHICTNIIPYGPSFPGQNGIAHQPNEFIDIDDLILCAKVYAYALYKLSLIDEIEKPLILK